MSSSVPDVHKWTIPKLKAFLRDKGRPCSGSKAVLVQAVQEVLQSPSLVVQVVQPTANINTFKDSSVVWDQVTEAKSVTFPKNFNMEQITRFLTDVTVFISPGLSTMLVRKIKSCVIH